MDALEKIQVLNNLKEKQNDTIKDLRNVFWSKLAKTAQYDPAMAKEIEDTVANITVDELAALKEKLF